MRLTRTICPKGRFDIKLADQLLSGINKLSFMIKYHKIEEDNLYLPYILVTDYKLIDDISYNGDHQNHFLDMILQKSDYNSRITLNSEIRKSLRFKKKKQSIELIFRKDYGTVSNYFEIWNSNNYYSFEKQVELTSRDEVASFGF
jgi:hypothetical protein